MVKKPNGKYRFCVDSRRLNEITVNHVTNVPSISEVFDRLRDATFFTVLDLRSGYWQLPIRKQDRAKTFFNVGSKQYCFMRMPFGLSGAPSTFRRLMFKVLDGLSNT
ncbi:reverse transcriptase domain-containing protein, partial [Acinetobacter baumannii]|uniref:reverse transcriptase family protein n=1 Tax=Acinetobacter baumannii TaxID=470 RepID=UPI003392500A